MVVAVVSIIFRIAVIIIVLLVRVIRTRRMLLGSRMSLCDFRVLLYVFYKGVPWVIPPYSNCYHNG